MLCHNSLSYIWLILLKFLINDPRHRIKIQFDFENSSCKLLKTGTPKYPEMVDLLKTLYSAISTWLPNLNGKERSEITTEMTDKATNLR